MEYKSFIDDREKIDDLLHLSQDEFLESYSYLTREEYALTIIDIMKNNRTKEFLTAVDVVCGECSYNTTVTCDTCPVRKNVDRITETKKSIYDQLSRVLTDWENQNAVDDDLYSMLVKIQRLWETVITAEDHD